MKASVVAVMLLGASAVAAPASAQEPTHHVAARAAPSPRIRWSEHWPKFRPAELAFTGGLALQVASAVFLLNPPTANFRGGMLYDDDARDLLRARTREARVATATASDVMYYALAAYPLLDAPIVAAASGSREVAEQTLAINLESYALGGAIALSAERAGRVRPLAEACLADPDYDPRCADEGRMNQSNLSGHTTIAVTGAALTCVHHLHLPLYGGGAPDIAACAAAMTLGLTSGVLRVVSDNQHATDVTFAALVGLGSGYVLPLLLHYRLPRAGADRSRSLLPIFRSRALGIAGVLAPAIGPGMTGATLQGTL